MISVRQGWTLLDPSTPTFGDVPQSSPFYGYVETAVAHGIISGYADGTFRPNADVTRGQLCKIVMLAEGWTLLNPASPRFSDVAANNPFYAYVETAARGVVSGYADGSFHVGNGATRGQIAKISFAALNSWASWPLVAGAGASQCRQAPGHMVAAVSRSTLVTVLGAAMR